MNIELTRESNPLTELFQELLSIEGESEYRKLLFVEELLACMKEQGISWVELARRMNVPPSRITSMLTGTNNFTIETMVRAARASDLSVTLTLTPASRERLPSVTSAVDGIRAQLSQSAKASPQIKKRRVVKI